MSINSFISKKKDQIGDKLNAFSEKHPRAEFLYKVNQQYGDDNGGQLVGAITYYMFLSLLPLLLVSLTIFDIVLANNNELHDRIVKSTFAAIPVVGPTLETNLSFVKDKGITLFVTLIVLLWAARGGALALQSALWKILKRTNVEQSFVSKQGRAYGAMAIISFGLIFPTVLSSFATGNLLLAVIVFIATTFWNMGLIYVIFYILVNRESAKGIGPIIGGIGISVVQFLSVFITERSLENARPLYGTLAVVLVLMAWIALQVKVVLYSAEMNQIQNS